MKTKLKILSLLLAALCLCAALSACLNPAEPGGETPPESEASETEESESSEPAPEESAGSEEKLPLNCEYALIEELENFGPTGILEFEGSLLILNYGKDLLAYNSKTGEKLYEIPLSDESSPAKLFATDQKEEYDCCVAYDDCIVYLNSKDPKAVLKEELPVEIDNSNLRFRERLYSWYGDKFIYQTSEGISLFDTESGKEKLILKNSEVETKLRPITAPMIMGGHTPPDGTEPYYYFDPQFICSGKKVAFKVASWEYTFVAFGVYNIETDEIELAFNHFEQFNSAYPFEDRYLQISDYAGVKTIDAKTLEVVDRPDPEGSPLFSYIDDFSLAIVYKYTPDENHGIPYYNNDLIGLKCYLCSASDLLDESNLIFSVTDDVTGSRIAYIGDDFLVVELFDVGGDDEKNSYCIVKYR